MTWLGPVFASERSMNARRWRIYAQRSLFVALLLAALVTVWSGRIGRRATGSLQGLAELGQTFFLAVVGTQMVIVLLAAPAATAGAICLERARGTLTHLLVTDLSDTEIVLGKLAARLIPVLLMVACGVPVLSLLSLLGGVDAGALAGALVVTAGLAVLGCSLALALSLWAGRTHEALLGAYAIWVLWLLVPYFISYFGRYFGWFVWMPPLTSDPFQLAFAPYFRPGSVEWVDYLGFFGGTLAISSALAALAVVRLRPVCTRDPVKRGRRTSTTSIARALRWLDRQWLRLPGPSLDFNPVLWREWHRNRPSRGSRAIIAAFVGLALCASAAAIASGAQRSDSVVNAFQVAIGLLLLSVTASTSLAEERARGSLDVLLATPMSTREIVMGKWLAASRFIPFLAILPTIVVLARAGWDTGKWPVAGLMAAYVTAAGAAVTALGVLLATWCTGLGRAVGATIFVYILVTVGWMFLVVATCSPHPYGYAAITGSPWYAPIVIASLLDRSGHYLEDLTGVILWIITYLAANLVLLHITLATFDGRLGRARELAFRPEIPLAPDRALEHARSSR